MLNSIYLQQFVPPFLSETRTTMAFKQIFVLVILAFAVDALKWKNCGM